jgi:hemoglobin-like flavoprotein
LMTLEEVLGRDFDSKVSQAWIRVYSTMLREILPAAVDEETRRWESRNNKRASGFSKTMDAEHARSESKTSYK